jgi:hypothetical protein
MIAAKAPEASGLKALGAERQSGQQQAGEKQRGGTAEIVQHMPPETF